MKYNIGDRVITTKLVYKSNGKSCSESYNVIGCIPTARSNLYKVEVVGIDNTGYFYENEIELDKEYYRDIKLNELLK